MILLTSGQIASGAYVIVRFRTQKHCSPAIRGKTIARMDGKIIHRFPASYASPAIVARYRNTSPAK